MKLKKLLPISGIIGMSVLMLAAQPAVAVDSKTYPGSACEPTTPTLPYFENIVGGLVNPNTQLLSVNCPIVRDNIAGNSTAGIAQVLVQVIDRHPTKSVSCSVSSVRDTGQTVEGNARSSSGSDPNVQTLTFTDLASTSGGFYTLFCNIPPESGTSASGIVMYRVDEN